MTANILCVLLVLAAGCERQSARPTGSAVQSGPLEQHFHTRHDMNLNRKNQGRIDLLFLGDSITEGWQFDATRDLWDKLYAPLNAANFGVSGDRTQQVIWRITQGGELDGLSPKLLVLMIGTNNVGEATPEEIAKGVAKIIGIIKQKMPHTKILLLSVLPRTVGGDAALRDVNLLNARLAKMDDGKSIHYLDISPRFLDANGQPRQDLFTDGLHLSRAGYQAWAEAMQPTLKEMLNSGSSPRTRGEVR